VHALQRIDALLELNVVGGQLRLVVGLAQLLLDILLGACGKGCEGSAAGAMSAYLCVSLCQSGCLGPVTAAALCGDSDVRKGLAKG
jgi:hypothetical protein